MLTLLNPCTRCGSCCKALGAGLPLFPWEFRAYRALAAQRHLSFTASPQSSQSIGGRNIVSHYLVTTSPCVHFDQERGCTIYEGRPLVCRAFPFQYVHGEFLFSRCDARAAFEARVVALPDRHADEQFQSAIAIFEMRQEIGNALGCLPLKARIEGAPLVDVDELLGWNGAPKGSF